jgi:hypothetical protein
MRFALLVSLAFACGNAAAAGNADIADFVADDMHVESRIDADLTGDGLADVAFVAVGEESRRLTVLTRHRVTKAPKADQGFEAIDSLELEITPLGAGSLSAKKGVLMLEDLTGGTTATAATYRYRFDPEEGRMRLIGLDAERYSRTNSHGTIRLSWNLLTGAHLVQVGELDESGKGDAAYRFRPEQRTVQKSVPIYMSETPAPDGLIDAEQVPAGEDRD